MLSPYKFRILLDVYTGAEIAASIQPMLAYDEAIKEMVEMGLICPVLDHETVASGVEWMPTDKLLFFIHYVMKLPMPAQEWRMPC